MESGNKLLTLAQAAELSACSTKTLRRAIDAGELAACGHSCFLGLQRSTLGMVALSTQRPCSKRSRCSQIRSGRRAGCLSTSAGRQHDSATDAGDLSAKVEQHHALN